MKHFSMFGENFNKNHILLTVFWLFALFSVQISLAANSNSPGNIPFSTNRDHLTIWNGTEYVPFFVKGINLGIAVPGTFPGELAASRADYGRWFAQIKEAGFNVIRLYTLHFPHFYAVLDSFNMANRQNPLLFIQGVWLEEEVIGYNHDLKSLTPLFLNEIEENIDAVHGNRVILPRRGKAYGNFSTDASEWCLAYIIGREIFPVEVVTTDSLHAGTNHFTGQHFRIQNASPTEAWAARMLNHTVAYNQLRYNTQRPVSMSSWPTLDPLRHPEERNPDEDLTTIDLSKLLKVDAPAGFFISYHAYPYYPNFISINTRYQHFADKTGPNSYLGYLLELRAHYQNIPLLIAEFGVPSSWVNAHFASSGMNHGGYDEKEQGLNNLRLLNTIQTANLAGGIQFSWLDEWFKRTWVADPLDYVAESRILWHNQFSAEQNFGLVAFSRPIKRDTLAVFSPSNDITYLKAEIDYAFFNLEIGLRNPPDNPDEYWVTFDTYNSLLGESILPSGSAIMPGTRAEFALRITNYSANLYVTQAYDVFGIWHGTRFTVPQQLFRSIATDGAPWEIVRVRNNHPHQYVQFNGHLRVNPFFQPPSSKDAVTIHSNKINIRIPWNYLNVVAPNQLHVLHDDRLTPDREHITTDGIQVAVLYNGKWFSHANRFLWDTWHYVRNTHEMERLKQSYFVFKDNQSRFNTQAIAVVDSFYFDGAGFSVFVPANRGLLANDFDLDGTRMTSLVLRNPRNGKVFVRGDGSFTYFPDHGFTGSDTLEYVVFDGHSLSSPNYVILHVASNLSDELLNDPTAHTRLHVFPNPAYQTLSVRSKEDITELRVFDLHGKKVEAHTVNNNELQLNVSHYQAGAYIIIARTSRGNLHAKFIKR